MKAQASSDQVEEIDRGVWHQFWRTLILLIDNDEDKFRKTKIDPIVQLLDHQRNWYALRMANIFGSLTEDPSKSSVHRAHVKLRANAPDTIHWRFIKPLELIIGAIPEEVKVEGYHRALWDQCWQAYMLVEGAERLTNFINVLKIMIETTLRRYKEMRKNKRLKDGGINGKAAAAAAAASSSSSIASMSSPSSMGGARMLPVLSTLSPSPSPKIGPRRLSNAGHSNLKQPSPRTLVTPTGAASAALSPALSTTRISPTNKDGYYGGNGNGDGHGNGYGNGKNISPSSKDHMGQPQSTSSRPMDTDMYYDQVQTSTSSKPPTHKKVHIHAYIDSTWPFVYDYNNMMHMHMT